MISVLDGNAGLGFVPLQGSYSAALFAGSFPSWFTLYQVGSVPAGTKSLQLDAYSVNAQFNITLGGRTLHMVPLSTVSRPGFPASYTTYGADILSFAGQVVQLSITELPPTPATAPGELFFDNIVFSQNSVPEPGALGLSVVGLLVLGWRTFRWRR